ncbi:RNA polymerase III transcription factor IIIC subunit-domain-containing protein [Leucosporidium creatinivorum]|uniref:RNA polymerase III transcription factor IIIC subunit-domain-containing protein n=1 Tax=Leucosporidium creatinivorum TaxID=106004 RepID=A0A1Y2BZB4_9BASI|nr:RNA polymerase III transcription factor IIIC subunit-domain-containing protein [Leucosporidium creatinivorum]
MSTYNLRGAVQLAAIEYPGPIQPTSLNKALKTMGGLSSVSQALAAPTKDNRSLELSLNIKNPFSHPVPAHIADTGNVLMRVVKRRRKNPKRDEQGKVVEEGIYTIAPVGAVTKTARFRAVADFQTSVDLQDPIVALSQSVREMDVAAIKSFAWTEPSDDINDQTFLPPPAFTRHVAPQIYDYRPAHGTTKGFGHYPVPGGVEGEGESYERMVNVTRWKGHSPQSIKFDDGDEKLPTKPEAKVAEEIEKEGKAQVKQYAKTLLACLEKRPMWTRTSLLNQLPVDDKRIVSNQKQVIPYISYTFSDGPFRDLVIRFGYDPRKDPEARFYQHIILRNIDNVRTKAPAIKGTSKGKEKQKEAVQINEDPLRSHLFDGQVLHSKIANFQLCDISDPLIKQHVDASEGVRDTCDKQSAWYDSDYFEQIRQLVRRKVAGLLAGRVVSDAECADLLGDPKADVDELAGKKKGGEKRTTRSRSRSASASSNGGQSGTDGEGGSEGGSGTEGSDAGTDAGDATTGKKKTRTRFSKSRKSQGMPWQEKDMAKKRRRAKARAETEEERGIRLRRALGVGTSGQGNPSTSSSAGDWGHSASEGPEEDEAEDEDDAMEE